MTIESVRIGDTKIYNAQLEVTDAGAFALIGYSETPPSSGEVIAQCSSGLITLEKFEQLSAGITREQANSITGCEGVLMIISGDLKLYEWSGENIRPQIRLAIEGGTVQGTTFIP